MGARWEHAGSKLGALWRLWGDELLVFQGSEALGGSITRILRSYEDLGGSLRVLWKLPGSQSGTRRDTKGTADVQRGLLGKRGGQQMPSASGAAEAPPVQFKWPFGFWGCGAAGAMLYFVSRMATKVTL